MTQEITIKSGAGDFVCYLSRPENQNKLPGIILIHEVWGLNDHIKDIANRFAGQGYAVLAPDLLSQTGILGKIDPALLKQAANPATRDEAQKKMRAAMAPIQAPEFAQQTITKLKACFDYLKSADFCSDKVAAVGFCFGGTYSYSLAVEQRGLSAAVVFYGHAPEPFEKIQNITCPVLVFNGEKDENLMNRLPDVKAAAADYGKDFEFKEYAEAGHAFFNDTNPSRYNKEAAEDAWEKSLAFLSRHLS